MTNQARAITVRKDLTDYAFSVMQDADALRAAIALLAPTVPTGGTSGQFNKFDETQAFKDYSAMAQRAVGGQSAKIEFLGSQDTYNAKPYGLRVSVDQFERDQAANNTGLLENAKTRTLTVNCLLAHLAKIVAVIKAGVSAVPGTGNWSDPAVDPVAELDAQILAMWRATGMLPNNLHMDFGAFVKARNHPKVTARCPGADIVSISPEKFASLLSAPVKPTINAASVLTGGGLGNSSATKTGVLSGSVLLFYNSQTPTQYDPSFCKTFAPAAQLFTEVFTYREEPHLDWYENNWTAAVELISALLCKRIDVT